MSMIGLQLIYVSKGVRRHLYVETALGRRSLFWPYESLYFSYIEVNMQQMILILHYVVSHHVS